MRSPHRQRGVALIMAILVVSLAVIAASAVLSTSHGGFLRTASLQDAERSWGYAAGVEDWARTLLERDAQDNQHDSLDEFWASPQTLPVEQGAISGELIDLQGRFNLNNLGLADHTTPLAANSTRTAFDEQVELFERLVGLLEDGPDLVPDARALAESIRDWIDADQLPTGSGREDGDYALLDPPRRAANRPMQSLSELRNVLAVVYGRDTAQARKVYRLLLPHVFALPVDGLTPINLNTATQPLLLAIDASGGNGKLRAFAEARLKQPITKASEILTALDLGPNDLRPQLLSVASRQFLLSAEVSVGNGRVALYSHIFRPPQGTPVVLWRSTDTL